jgi:hypothetical protein
MLISLRTPSHPASGKMFGQNLPAGRSVTRNFCTPTPPFLPHQTNPAAFAKEKTKTDEQESTSGVKCRFASALAEEKEYLREQKG